jgi:hypothetical protein
MKENKYQDGIMIVVIALVILGGLTLVGCETGSTERILFQPAPASGVDVRYPKDDWMKKKRKAEAVEATTRFKLGVGYDYWAITGAVDGGLLTSTDLGLTDTEYVQVKAQTKDMY